MRLSEPITIKRQVWVLLDITAILLVLGGFLVIYAIQSGAWNPLGSVTIGIWPWLLCSMWVAIATGVALLVGFQLAAGEAQHTPEGYTPAVESHQVAGEPEGATTPFIPGMPREDASGEPATATAEREEPALAGAGR
jgi:uncharacterized membrane protein